MRNSQYQPPVQLDLTFSKNKGRLLEHEVARAFLGVVLEEARRGRLLSEDHFTVDWTLVEAWAFRRVYLVPPALECR